MSEKAPSNLLEANNALGSYLDDMLHEATRVVEVRPIPDVTRIDKKLLPEALLCDGHPEEADVTIIDQAVEKSNTLIAEIETEFSTQEDEDAEVSLELPAEWFPLQCLMFRVADNLLSVPLVEIRSVVNWYDNLTCLPQEPDWMLGILQHREQNVRVVDSASILQIRNREDASPGHILVLGNEEWAITCDQIDKVVTLEYDDIQWNQNTGNKMIYGAIRESLASLLNPQGIVRSLRVGVEQKNA
ncbi:MAG: chemotaxis protein CheW [Gammaproteobacteria bacterium]|nr:chemotaxis protein CheW [Gammaproteobacteria bacterium]